MSSSSGSCVSISPTHGTGALREVRRKGAVLRNARKLKETGIFINEDLCAASQAKEQSQFPLMKEARSQGKIA